MILEYRFQIYKHLLKLQYFSYVFHEIDDEDYMLQQVVIIKILLTHILYLKLSDCRILCHYKDGWYLLLSLHIV